MIRNLFLCSLVLVFASMAALSEAEAGLTINFDPNSNELFFSGEDSGTPDVTTAFIPDPNGGDFSFIEVDAFSISFGNVLGDFVPFDAINFLISPDISALTADGAGILGAFTSIPGEGLGSGISLGIAQLENGDFQTIIADETVRFDISNSGADALAFLASLDGTTVSRFTPFGIPEGRGFAEAHVNVLPVAGVPEPAAATLLALTGLTLSCRRRRRS